MKRILAAAAIAGTALLMSGATVSAGEDYPPLQYPTTTVPATTVPATTVPATTVPATTVPADTTTTTIKGDSGAAVPTTVAAELPATGGDSGSTVWIAGMLLLAGGGMFAISRARRNQPLTS